MNKGKIVNDSQKKQPLREYMAFLKSRSKEKSDMMQRKSKSPARISTSPKSSQNTDWMMLQKRYHQLQEKYSGLLEEVKNRSYEYEKLKSQAETYKKIHQNDLNQIEKLRSVLGLTKKQSVQTQVDQLLLEINVSNRVSRANKFDQSTQDDIKMKQSWEKFNSKDKDSEFKLDKNMKIIASEKKLPKYTLNYPVFSFKDINEKAANRHQNEEQQQQTGRFHKKLSNSPYSKLRFIPKTNY